MEEVTAKFEELYQGVEGQLGLKDLETLIPAKGRWVGLQLRPASGHSYTL